jgi:hypothetical protein
VGLFTVFLTEQPTYYHDSGARIPIAEFFSTTASCRRARGADYRAADHEAALWSHRTTSRVEIVEPAGHPLITAARSIEAAELFWPRRFEHA